MRPRRTIADVARLAGVSTATAGRVLGGYGYASEARREQVMRAAEALGYRPNALARSLITGKTRTIGVVAGDIQNAFYASILRGISDVLEQHGFGLLITNSDENLDREVRAVELLLEKQVDGMIVSPCDTRGAGHLRGLAGAGAHLVLIDRAVAGLEVDRVLTDNVAAAEHSVAQLIALGHRRIGIVAELVGEPRGQVADFIRRVQAGTLGEAASLYPSWQRFRGYIRAHQAAGLAVDPDLIRRAGVYAPDAARVQTHLLLDLATPPTAIFATDGTMSEGVVRALSDRGLELPRDLSLSCFDDLDWMGFYRPGITTAAQPRLAMGEAAAQLLLDRIEGATVPHRSVVLPAELIRRGSVAAPGRA